MKDLIKKNNGEILVDMNVAVKLREFYKQKALMDIQEKELKEQLKNAMLENNIQEWKMELDNGGYMTAKIKKAYTKTTIDSKKLKEELPDIAEQYSKKSEVAESLLLEVC